MQALETGNLTGLHILISAHYHPCPPKSLVIAFVPPWRKSWMKSCACTFMSCNTCSFNNGMVFCSTKTAFLGCNTRRAMLVLFNPPTYTDIPRTGRRLHNHQFILVSSGRRVGLSLKLYTQTFSQGSLTLKLPDLFNLLATLTIFKEISLAIGPPSEHYMIL